MQTFLQREIFQEVKKSPLKRKEDSNINTIFFAMINNILLNSLSTAWAKHHNGTVSGMTNLR